MGVKITALPASILTDVTYDDIIPIVDLAGPTTQKATLDLVRQSMFAGSGYTAVTLAGVTSLTYSLSMISTTALATPSALVATTSQVFASTVSGATIMGYGTTADVTLKNRAGTDVIKVTSNTTGVVMAGALAITGALSGVTTAAVSGLITSTATTGIIASAAATATPSAYSATQGTFLASTVSGATLMGFGTTGDVTLQNRAGTDVIVVTANTTGVTMAGALAMTGALSGVTTLVASSTISYTGSTFTLDQKSNTAFATPSALSATGYRAFASTVSGAATMGYGTTNDVSLLQKSGAVAAGVPTGTTNFVVVGGFGCNAATAQTAYASGGALAAYGAGANGFDSGANASALHAMVVAVRAALVANGIMS